MKKEIHIVLAADHRGFAHKEFLKQQKKIGEYTIVWHDVGAHTNERSDYPPFAQAACAVILQGLANYGILLCGTGIGMAIAANRFKGIYAGLVWSAEIARLSKEDDNTNVLVFAADFITESEILKITQTWLSASFKQGRYQQRLEMIDTI